MSVCLYRIHGNVTNHFLLLCGEDVCLWKLSSCLACVCCCSRVQVGGLYLISVFKGLYLNNCICVRDWVLALTICEQFVVVYVHLIDQSNSRTQR